MPRYLRKAGEFAGKLRRMAYDMRAKSGIDEVLRSEGIGSDIAEIRRLASFARGEIGNILSSVQGATGLNDVAGSLYGDSRPRPVPPKSPLASSLASSTNPTTGIVGDAALAPVPAPLPGPVAFAVAAAGAASAAASNGAPVPAGTVLAPNGRPAAPMAPAPIAATPLLVTIDREREYPNAGADSYAALPEDSSVYDGQLPSSPLAGDPLYARGEPSEDASSSGEGAHAEARP
jgi:hypothetical protein